MIFYSFDLDLDKMVLILKLEPGAPILPRYCQDVSVFRKRNMQTDT